MKDVLREMQACSDYDREQVADAKKHNAVVWQDRHMLIALVTEAQLLALEALGFVVTRDGKQVAPLKLKSCAQFSWERTEEDCPEFGSKDCECEPKEFDACVNCGTWQDQEIERLEAIVADLTSENVEAEIWALAQLLPGEGMEDGFERIRTRLHRKNDGVSE